MFRSLFLVVLAGLFVDQNPISSQRYIIPYPCQRNKAANGKFEIFYGTREAILIFSGLPQGTYSALELVPYADRYQGYEYPEVNLTNLTVELESTDRPVGPHKQLNGTRVYNGPISFPEWTQSHPPGLMTAYFEPNANWVIPFNQPFMHNKTNLSVKFRFDVSSIALFRIDVYAQPSPTNVFSVIEGPSAFGPVNDIIDYRASIQYDLYDPGYLIFVMGVPAPGYEPSPTHFDLINLGAFIGSYTFPYYSHLRNGPYLGHFETNALLGTYLTSRDGYFLMRLRYIPEIMGIPIGAQRIRINALNGQLEGTGMVSYVSSPFIYSEEFRPMDYWSDFNKATTIDCPVMIFHRQ